MTKIMPPAIRSKISAGIILLIILITFPSTSAQGEKEEDPDLLEVVTPLIGTPFTNFTFNLTINTSAVGYPDQVSIQIDNTTRNMTGNNSHFLFSTPLHIGNHSHRYIINISGDHIYYPETGSFPGPYVINTTENSPPVITEVLVTPMVGNTSDVFRYYVNYTDMDNDPPRAVIVFINGTGYNMTEFYGSDFTEGVWYRLRVLLPSGNHTYKFYATDGFGESIAPLNGSFTGPSVEDQAPEDPQEVVDDEDEGKNLIIMILAILAALIVTSVLIVMSFMAKNFTGGKKTDNNGKPSNPPSS